MTLERKCFWAFGFFMLGGYLWLAHSVAIGTVEEKTSFGLGVLLTVMVGVGTKWAENIKNGDKQ